MIVLEEPYVSELLLNYLEKTQIPVLDNDFAHSRKEQHSHLNLIDDSSFRAGYEAMREPKLYTVSEYALDRVCSILSGKELLSQVSLLKDKYAFRKACANMYEGFVFQEIKYADLFTFDVSKIQMPFVLKPSVGFLSAGVYTIENEKDWKEALTDIEKNFKALSSLFPNTVVGDGRFLIESYIKGTEFAVDVFFKDYKPNIVNIFEHRFSSSKDVSDRLYLTNKELFDFHLEQFTTYIAKLNSVLHLNNITVHIEMRAEGNKIIPIEINPLRFTGMCLNELLCYITGEHPLTYFFEGKTPDYSSMWKGKEDKTYYFSIIEKPQGVKNPLLDVEKLEKQFSNILELRLINNPKLNIMAHIFASVDCTNNKELERISTLDVTTLLK
jgi:hypothetical protein